MRSKLFTAVAAATAVVCLPAIASADMTRVDFQREQEQIDNRLDLDKQKCKTYGGNARDICFADATGRYKVAMAELEDLKSPGSNSRYKVRIARAEADYEIARYECDERSGATKEACLEQARSAFTSDKLDARSNRR